MPDARINGVTIHYDIAGAGPALVFIHGLGSSGEDWEAQAKAFSVDYRVITVDLRGHGRSERPHGPYSIAMFANDVSGLIEQLRIGPAHIVGISMGGAVAFQLATDTPQQVRSLTIVNSGPEMILRTFRQKLAIWQRFLIIQLFGLPRLGRVLAKRLFPGAENLQQTFAGRFGRNDTGAYRASLRALIGWSVNEHLGRIGCPTLVVASDQDYTPVAVKEQYAARLPNARVAVIPDSRHAVPMERPGVFNRVLGEFLASAGPSSTAMATDPRKIAAL